MLTIHYNSWLPSVTGDSSIWTITHDRKSIGVFLLNYQGRIDHTYVGSESLRIVPVVYLKSNVRLASGTGTKENPFILEM